ncbi:sce7725 family protein [Pseudomonas sp. P9_31]|uniref:sce7725 family protein n=1 Tax=Pseudomonas sp. P9_31 TaxID=3043448 RepID=UPI002A36013E|nr:sce7725 family protein [Pseudomonas sp. P9_31]WPN59411.1 sce7725 family protein [Pseudomonas sp. P9_31]
MYFPILKGKQNELIALRELSEIIDAQYIKPVVEPVRENISPLKRTIKQLADNGIIPLVVINPSLGDYAGGEDLISQFLQEEEGAYLPCVKIKSPQDSAAIGLFQSFRGRAAAYIESSVDRAMVDVINESVYTLVNPVRVSSAAFAQLRNKVVYGDFFKKEVKNSDYAEDSLFSGLHTEYREFDNVVGFGDFTILSEDYSESGGPAYVVAVHLSYINREEYDAMHVRHFSSYDDRTPTNPGGKFMDALNKLVQYVTVNPNKFTRTTGLGEFFTLHASRHYPGLGHVKKISIKHHIETTCHYIQGH